MATGGFGGRIERPFIDAYGDGGFRAQGARHEGSVLVIADRVEAWAVKSMAEVDDTMLAALAERARGASLLILGTGAQSLPLSRARRALVEERGLGLEVMATGAACRTYNVLRAEERAVAAALIAVD